MNELDAIQAIDFDWTMHLSGVWSDSLYDTPTFQEELRRELDRRLDDLHRDASQQSPLGWSLVGSGGMGKTHLLSTLRRLAFDRGMAFVLVDMTDVHDFWETVLLGYLNSLQQDCGQGRYQYQAILERFLGTLRANEPAAIIVRKLQQAKTPSLASVAGKVLGALSLRHRREAMQHQDVIRAVIALNSNDFDVSSTGLTWLLGHEIEEPARADLGFVSAKRPPREIVEALSWMMSLVGPTVLALDQLDPIVTHLNIAARGADSDEARDETRVARAIIEKIAAGLGALRDVTRRTLTVISCLEATWDRLVEQVALKTNLDRFEPPRRLKAVNCRETADAILLGRLTPAYRRVGFSPPYATWPFRTAAWEGIQGLSPRQLLQFGYDHVRYCREHGKVMEATTLTRAPGASAGSQPPEDKVRLLDTKFDQLRQQAELPWILEEAKDDERLAPLLQSACRCLLREVELRAEVEAVVDVDFHGGKTTRPLHARVRLIHHEEDEWEEHFCLRALERANARAFQARLNAAIIQAGIDRYLRFRHLIIVRSTAPPGGQVTGQLLERFRQATGVLMSPSEDELRTLWALHQLQQDKDPHLLDWLRRRRPASGLLLLQAVVDRLKQYATSPVGAPGAPGAPATAPSAGRATVDTRETTQPPVATTGDAEPAVPPTAPATPIPQPAARSERPTTPAPLTLGWRWQGEKPVERISMEATLLNRHTVILAGAGSGKTVLIRRLVEEVALQGIPSIVIDCANDLATLGDRWPQTPPGWVNGDESKADAYFQQTTTVVWTPGRETGNPLRFEPLPDLAAVAEDDDELTSAIEMVWEWLRPIVAPGVKEANALKQGILTKALRYFAKHDGGRLSDFVEFLKELPAAAGLGVHKEAKLVHDMADRLKAEIAINALLAQAGTVLDPAVLFGDTPDNAKTRISVISLAGLAGLEPQRQFLNQLAMTLFAWIKKNPNPGRRPLRGLLVIDEAKDFVPSQATTACKASLIRLVAQARKYHLGLVFATQNPKEIENTIISNCSTHFYGKAGSPEAIKVVREQIQLRGGTGDDVPALPKGTFFAYNIDAKVAPPVKLHVPLCLSHHRANPLDEQEVLQRARKSREQISPH